MWHLWYAQWSFIQPEEEWNHGISRKITGSGSHHIKWNKVDSERLAPYSVWGVSWKPREIIKEGRGGESVIGGWKGSKDVYRCVWICQSGLTVLWNWYALMIICVAFEIRLLELKVWIWRYKNDYFCYYAVMSVVKIPYGTETLIKRDIPSFDSFWRVQF